MLVQNRRLELDVAPPPPLGEQIGGPSRLSLGPTQHTGAGPLFN